MKGDLDYFKCEMLNTISKKLYLFQNRIEKFPKCNEVEVFLAEFSYKQDKAIRNVILTKEFIEDLKTDPNTYLYDECLKWAKKNWPPYTKRRL